MQEFVGNQIDIYRVITRFGQGGMAAINHAQSTLLGLEVAFKLIRMECTPVDQYERFFRR